MKQFSQTPNVGDAIGARIVESIAGRPVRIVGEEFLSVPNLIAIGSIAHWSDAHSVLWGCGLIAPHLRYTAPAEVLALRGALTRDHLTAHGVRCPDVLGDVGLLLPDLIPASEPVHPVGLVPHYVDRESAFVDRCRREGVPVLDVYATPEAFVHQLTSCRRIVSSSLHGIILAHAYGREAVWVTISDGVHGDGFKFYDYYSSIGVAARDVPVMRPGEHAIGTMANACWRADALPDRAPLREALARRILDLDV